MQTAAAIFPGNEIGHGACLWFEGIHDATFDISGSVFNDAAGREFHTSSQYVNDDLCQNKQIAQ